MGGGGPLQRMTERHQKTTETADLSAAYIGEKQGCDTLPLHQLTAHNSISRYSQDLHLQLN
jgi:hypothetical protein